MSPACPRSLSPLRLANSGRLRESLEVSDALRTELGHTLADQYVNEELPTSGGREHVLLAEVGPGVKRRGFLDPADILDVTQLALSARTPDCLCHQVLMYLTGVGHPVASAILTVWGRDLHAVLDLRVVEVLQELAPRRQVRLPVWAGGRNNLPGYLAFRQQVVAIRDAVDPTIWLRDFDRAVWKWHKDGMP